MKQVILKSTFLMMTLIWFSSCTNLEVDEKDSVIIESSTGDFAGIDPAAGVATGYADLRGYGDQANLFALLEVTTDELLVPTRGTDWGDNGVWRTLHAHNWDATHPYVLAAWNNLNSNVFRLNQLIAPESGASTQQLAEGKFLRALNMFYLLDLYGQVPFRGVNDGPDVNPEVFTSEEAFDFIMTDLEEALPNLPVRGPGADNTLTATRAAGNFLKAKLYLNKHIYLGTEPNSSDMDQVIEAVDVITGDGYQLQEGYFDIFKPDSDTETILWSDTSVGNRMWCTLHYNQRVSDNEGGGWNGFTTLSDFYGLFEGPSDLNVEGGSQEERRGYVADVGIGYGFLVGQQNDREGNDLSDRAGNPLVFTKELPGLAGNNERTGIRILKYNPENGAFTNHLILFRYADALLMKAEAILRGGSSSDNALSLVNELRQIRKASDLSSLDLPELLNERGRELYIEGWRRNDQIRFGTFSQTWEFKESTDDFRRLFPIPNQALTSNPNLTQNPGY